jgi:hypothetical protein
MFPRLEAVARYLVVLASFALLGVAWGQQLTPQQERMKSCNAQAEKKDLKGDERQAFMSECLRVDAGDKKLTAQQERMRSCNAQASNKELKGDERQEFMSRCLKGDTG